MKRFILMALCLLIVLPAVSLARGQNNIGILMRVDPSPRIGMEFQLSQKFALRPYVGFSMGKTESDIRGRILPNRPLISGTREEESSRFNVGLGVLFYVYSVSDFFVYTGANFNYARESSQVTFSWNSDKREDTGDLYTASAMLGLKCQVLQNLGIFGEIGLGYSYGKFEHENALETSSKHTRWGLTNSGIGLIFYF